MSKILLSALLLALTTVHAEVTETTEKPSPQPATAGTQTEAWLELQRSGEVASHHQQPMSGEAMDRVHARYLKSLEHPVPVFFEHEQMSNK